MNKQNNNEDSVKIEYIQSIRCASAILIFLCHAFGESNTSLGNILGQFFNVGVPIFFILSGYLYSRKQMPDKIFDWYKSRIIKLILPLYIFLIGLFIVHNICQIEIVPVVWFFNVIPLCGITSMYIEGCGHLWFITHIFICYLLVPVLLALKAEKKCVVKILLGYMLCTVTGTFLLPDMCIVLLHSIGSFLLGFYILPQINLKTKKIIGLGGIAVCARIIGKIIFDNTPVYDQIIVDCTHKILAVCIIFYVCNSLQYIKKISNVFYKKLLDMSDEFGKYTYEFYLVHYVFLNGHLKINQYRIYTVNCLIAVIWSLLLSLLVHKIVQVILQFWRKI